MTTIIINKRKRKRQMKTGICSRCNTEILVMQLRYPLICGDCNIKYNIIGYRKRVKATFDPPRY
jgi:hypothetical protein